MPRKKTEKDYRELAESIGYSWQGPMVSGAREKTIWLCGSRHEYESSYSNLVQGRRCRTCGNLSKAEKMNKSPADYRKLAEEVGYKWLGPVVKNIRQKTAWKCPSDHNWSSSYSHVQQGRRCRQCAIESRAASSRLTVDDYKSLARQMNCEWLGPQVTGALVYTNWRCLECKKEWKSKYNWLQQGQRCPNCARLSNMRDSDVSELQLKRLAERRKVEWLGPFASKKSDETNWRCVCGNEFQATYNSLQRRYGCKVCGTKRKAPKRRRLVDDDYHFIASERGFKWIGPSVPNNQTKTGWICASSHEFDSTYGRLQQGKGCDKCARDQSARSRRHTKGDYRKLAKANGIVWIGSEVPRNSNTKTSWKCKDDHEWNSTYQKIKAGRGCRFCAIKDRADSQRLTEADYESLALERGFIWCGADIRGRHDHTVWICGKGHNWSASFANIKLGRGCPVCGRLAAVEIMRLKKSDYKKLASDINWTWLGPLPGRSSEKTRWKCQKGHRLSMAYNWIQGGNRCQECADMENGKRVSRVQRKIAEMVGGELNYKVENRFIDVALIHKGQKIGIEYDSYYWHGDKIDEDEKRTSQLVEAGWKVLSIKSNFQTPQKEEIDAAIQKLLDGKTSITITMPDWGKGPIVDMA